jgi:putative inorganic carbon (hco3(-)) transporter
VSSLVLTFLSIIWAYAVFMGGGVWTRDWYPCLAAIATLALAYFAFTRRANFAPPLPASRRGALIALSAVAALQLIPLPLGLVRVVSPARAALSEALGAVGAPAGAVTLSVVSAASWEWSVTLLGLVLTYLLVRELAHRHGGRPWIAAVPLIVVATLQGALGLLQGVLGGASRAEGATGSYANRNHFAGLLEMCLPFAVMGAVKILNDGRAFSRRQTPLRPALGASGLLLCAAAMFLAVLVSLSRMGFIATLAGLAVMGSLALARERGGARRWLPAVAMILAALAAFVLLPSDQLVARFSDISGGEQVFADARTLNWGDTLRLIRAYPLFGCGLGAFQSALLPYKTVAPLFTVDYAHNDYLQLLAELGIVGFVPLIFLVAVIYARAVRHAMRLRRGPEAYLALAAAGGLTAIALHSLADFNLYIPANAMAAVWLGALADRP